MVRFLWYQVSICVGLPCDTIESDKTAVYLRKGSLLYPIIRSRECDLGLIWTVLPVSYTQRVAQRIDRGECVKLEGTSML